MTEAQQLILAIDQGTGSTKGLVLDENHNVLISHSESISISSPNTGWVEQDANEIWQSVRLTVDHLTKRVSQDFEGAKIAGLALTNQRESAIAWNLKTGEPLGPMLGWQDRRTAYRLAEFSELQKSRIESITGLPLDPMFSALKFAWLLDEFDADRSKSSAGEIALGTVDSWLIYKLTGEHRVEIGNASRTQLLDIASGQWSSELLELFGIPAKALPRVADSDEPSEQILTFALAGKRVLAVLADSHAALFAHSATVKATFGTGSSIMALTESAAAVNGLVRTVAWSAAGRVVHALEGNILSSGSTVVWLAKLLDKSASELADLAAETESTNINLVPAFGGLGAPWWDANAEAIITGLNLATTAADLSRAAFEAIALQIEDVVAAVEAGTGNSFETLNVDGGPTANSWLMQLQADISQREVVSNQIAELSAVGVASFAALQNGVWQSKASPRTTTYQPKISADVANLRKASWREAVNKSRMQGSSK